MLFRYVTTCSQSVELLGCYISSLQYHTTVSYSILIERGRELQKPACLAGSAGRRDGGGSPAVAEPVEDGVALGANLIY